MIHCISEDDKGGSQRERELSSVTMINIPITGNNVNRWEDNRKLNNYIVQAYPTAMGGLNKR